MLDKMHFLEKNQTWDCVDLKKVKKVMGCKWIFVVKVNLDGSVARLKARLVCKGYSQTYSIDYSNTFYPVAKLISVCLIIYLATFKNQSLHKLDTNNAFLHNDVQEEVHMK